MSGRSFSSLFLVASCAGAALSCYLVSLRVASERAALEGVETRIVLTQRDMRVLQTELGTRSRLSQLERWNAGAFALSAPGVNQFVAGGFELAKLTRPDRKIELEAPVVLAAAPAPEPHQPPLGARLADESGTAAAIPARRMLHEASLKTETREVPVRTAAELPQAADPNSTSQPVKPAKPAPSRPVDRPGLAAAQTVVNKMPRAGAKPADKKVVDKPALVAAKPVTKPVRLAKTDPLAPLPDKHSDRGTPTGR